jgi:hypothetical protein
VELHTKAQCSWETKGEMDRAYLMGSERVKVGLVLVVDDDDEVINAT